MTNTTTTIPPQGLLDINVFTELIEASLDNLIKIKTRQVLRTTGFYAGKWHEAIFITNTSDVVINLIGANQTVEVGATIQLLK